MSNENAQPIIAGLSVALATAVGAAIWQGARARGDARAAEALNEIYYWVGLTSRSAAPERDFAETVRRAPHWMRARLEEDRGVTALRPAQ